VKTFVFQSRFQSANMKREGKKEGGDGGLCDRIKDGLAGRRKVKTVRGKNPFMERASEDGRKGKGRCLFRSPQSEVFPYTKTGGVKTGCERAMAMGRGGVRLVSLTGSCQSKGK